MMALEGRLIGTGSTGKGISKLAVPRRVCSTRWGPSSSTSGAAAPGGERARKGTGVPSGRDRVGGAGSTPLAGVELESGVRAGRLDVGGVRLPASRGPTMASTSAREVASSRVNWMAMPGSRGGVEERSSDSTERTTPSPRSTFSPEASRSSKATAVPIGRGSRVRMKTPPRERLGAKRSLKSSSDW